MVSHVFKGSSSACFECPVLPAFVSPSSSVCPQNTFVLQASTPIQCRRANPRLPCSRRSPLVRLCYLISFHLSSSLITFASLTRDLTLIIGSVICLLFKHLHISTNPYLPRYSLRDPSSLTTISRLIGDGNTHAFWNPRWGAYTFPFAFKLTFLIMRRCITCGRVNITIACD